MNARATRASPCNRWSLWLPLVALPLTSPAQTGPAPAPNGLAVYALSRGKGVPAPTRSALREVRNLFEQGRLQASVQRIEQTRIGLEGETRLCAEFSDRAALHAAHERVLRLIADVELINVVVEPCATQGELP